MVGIRAAQAQTNEQDLWILTNPEPPFIHLDERGKLEGYAVDVVEGVLRTANLSQEILTAPWARVEQEAQQKANVLVFALARTPERESLYHWITPITANIFGVYSLKPASRPIRHLDDLPVLGDVGVLRGDVRAEILNRYKVPNVVEYNHWQQVVGSLLKQRVDSIFFSDAGLAYYCVQLNVQCDAVQRVFVYQQIQSYLVVSKPGTDPALVARLQEAAIQFKNSETYQGLVEHWLRIYRQQSPFPMHEEDGVLNLWRKENPYRKQDD
ncbi:transporter substrate-binding domain-containing protein [Aestuariibacter halophilus]|uniref:Transporter substrate-binding domain-containing protein n=1 Tax=Fluctibacter halophilus TaxID=226011 RepID=A0ABS8GCK8_9ALTE|nr:transporter substrate-binding domain-containing protein [Aestuariibacter halophilus]MCC2618267.1 transporter substrate-binding domain-containing protein [Aestuariibacter halophilus]